MSDGYARGRSSPLGATPSPEGVNFCVFSRRATGVQLLLFDRVDDAAAARVVRLDPSAHHTYHTFLDSPHDIVDWERAPLVPGHTYRAEPHSVVVPVGDLDPQGQS